MDKKQQPSFEKAEKLRKASDQAGKEYARLEEKYSKNIKRIESAGDKYWDKSAAYGRYLKRNFSEEKIEKAKEESGYGRLKGKEFYPHDKSFLQKLFGITEKMEKPKTPKVKKTKTPKASKAPKRKSKK